MLQHQQNILTFACGGVKMAYLKAWLIIPYSNGFPIENSTNFLIESSAVMLSRTCSWIHLLLPMY